MKITTSPDQLIELGLNQKDSELLLEKINAELAYCDSKELAWKTISKNLSTSHYAFKVHLFFFTLIYPNWDEHPETAPAWLPSKDVIAAANISKFMSVLNIHDVKTFHQWTIDNYQDFWQGIIHQLGIVFNREPEQICDLTHGIESPRWLPEAKLNITNSCFTADPSAIALIYEDGAKNLCSMSYAELNRLSNRIANSLIQLELGAGDAIGIAMPMSQYAVAIYIGIIKIGAIVVSIADSFSTQEIATRLSIANAKAIFTQDFSVWGGKKLPLFEKISKVNSTLPSLKIIVLPCGQAEAISLGKENYSWERFLVENAHFSTLPCDPMAACNILFSSGTTGQPKAIVWNHTTAIKAASDAYFHQNIQKGDILAWPTNLGWMMGPWLIYAALINQASLALYQDVPKDRGFGEFVQRAKVTMLGVVPTLVAHWRQTNCMEKLDWHTIKLFSSTGECSNPEDMLYLMSLAGYKPIIEYCGGTEIGGAYISSTVIQNNYPSLFSTPTMGLNISIIDEEGKPANIGEVAIIPPSIGLSTSLLNADHHHIYFANMPQAYDGKILRRHGDQIKRYSNGYYSVLGRVDDTMKLGGIKTSSAEIERSLMGLPNIIEVAAIAIQPPDNGPSQLVIFAATTAALEKQSILKEMQKKINQHLNPLFKIYDVVFTNELPKTASNKIMRRVLRKAYLEKTGV